jgi:flagellar protein FlaG
MEMGIRPERATAPAASPATPPRATDAPAATGNATPPAGKELPAVSVAAAIEQIEDFLADSQRQLTFQVDENSGRTVVRVVDPGSGEVIRQFPSEELLQVAATLERSGFRLFDGQA